PIDGAIDGLVQTNDGTLIGVDSAAQTLYTLDPTTGQTTVLSTPGVPIAGALAHDPATDTVYTVATEGATQNRYRLQSVDPTTGVLTPIGSGTTALRDVTGLTFDAASQQIIALDNLTDGLTAFRTDGLAIDLGRLGTDEDLQTLATLNGDLVTVGQRTVMDDDGNDVAVQSLLKIDVGALTSEAILDFSTDLNVIALHDAVTVGTAQRVTLSTDDDGNVVDATGIDFGLSGQQLEIRQVTVQNPILSTADRVSAIEFRLASRPDSDVVLTLAANDLSVDTSVPSLTFTPDNWDVAQAVDLTLLGTTTITSAELTVAVDTGNSDAAWTVTPDLIVPIQIDGTLGTTLSPAYISELLIDPLFGNNDTDQYVELRGVPGATLPNGTYLAVVEEDNISAGEIHGIFDLSGLSFGDNGYLVLLPQGSPFSPDVNANVLQSDEPGFGNLPGDIYQDSHPLSDRIDFIVGNNGFFLFQSDTAPQLTDDIDADNDGTADPDGVISNWRIFDSVSLHPNSLSDQAYGQTVLLTTNEDSVFDALGNRSVVPDANVQIGRGNGYAARVGASVGHQPGDWILSDVLEDGPEDPEVWELSDALFGPASPPAFFGRDLDHVGTDNFVGGVQGSLAFLPPLEGDVEPEALVAAGVSVLADTNGNGQQDVLTFVVEPDDAPDLTAPVGPLDQLVLTNAYPGVTIRSFSLDSISSGTVTAEPQFNFPDTLTNLHFTRGGIDWFTPQSRLRFDFYRPAREVSIVAIGDDSSFSPTYGRLEAYNADGDLLGFVRSGPLFSSGQEALSLAFGDDVIAYAMAYSDSDFNNGSPFGRFDTFSYQQSEAITVTDSSGIYELANLMPDSYDITVLGTTGSNAFVGSTTNPITVTTNENFQFFDANRLNSLPNVTPLDVTIDENPQAFVPFASVSATDADQQPLQFEILGESQGIQINAATGDLWVGDEHGVDFEANEAISFAVRVTDSAGGSTEVPVSLTVSDINEAPEVEPGVILVAENSINGEVVGRILATDPDVALAQTLTYEIVGGSGASAFAIDPDSGRVSVSDASALNFETTSTLELNVRISDSGNPALTTEIVESVQLIDTNDPPVVQTTDLTVAEDASGQIGRIFFSDPDTTQTVEAFLIGGTGESIFVVDGNGDVSIREGMKLDFESVTSYTLEIQVVDSGTPPAAGLGTVTINVTDADELPTLNNTTYTTTEDAAPGTVLGTLTVTDPDSTATPVDLTLAGPDANLLSLTPEGVLSVADGAVLDFERSPILAVSVRITDSSQPDRFLEQDLNISLLNVNELPSLQSTQIGISEATQEGALVKQLIAIDPEGDVVRFEIAGGSAGDLFSIDEDTGELRVAAGVDLDADVPGSDALELLVRLNDGVAGSIVVPVPVTINDVNEAPFFTDTLDPIQLNSGDPLELVLPEQLAVDPEGRDFLLTVVDETGSLPSWLRYDAAKRTLSGVPNPLQELTTTLFVRAFEPQGLAKLSSEIPLQISVDVGDQPLENRRDPFDVDNNGRVAALDALRIINFISRNGDGTVFDSNFDFSTLGTFSGFVDVNGDNIVTAFDALLVINQLLRNSAGASGEGEQLVYAGQPRPLSDLETHDEALDELVAGGLF
ncbi:MAG: cadherin domain-containing protein, partial [Planctomycetota bacterium]